MRRGVYYAKKDTPPITFCSQLAMMRSSSVTIGVTDQQMLQPSQQPSATSLGSSGRRARTKCSKALPSLCTLLPCTKESKYSSQASAKSWDIGTPSVHSLCSTTEQDAGDSHSLPSAHPPLPFPISTFFVAKRQGASSGKKGRIVKPSYLPPRPIPTATCRIASCVCLRNPCVLRGL